jgi:hypothetical protein
MLPRSRLWVLVEVHGNGSAIYARRIRPSRDLTQDLDLKLSLAALDIVDDASGSGIQVASSSH